MVMHQQNEGYFEVMRRRLWRRKVSKSGGVWTSFGLISRMMYFMNFDFDINLFMSMSPLSRSAWSSFVP